jgi:MipA family protein
MQSYFGITPAQSAASGMRSFSASAGLKDLHAGAGVTRALDEQWMLFGGAGVSRLTGDAASSPLTRSRHGWGVNLGLGYAFGR